MASCQCLIAKSDREIPPQEPKVKNHRKQEILFLRHVGLAVIASSASPEEER